MLLICVHKVRDSNESAQSKKFYLAPMEEKYMEQKILKILEKDGRATAKEIAEELCLEEKQVEKTIADLEESGIIGGYKAMINWDKLDENLISALIELKVTPQLDQGFDRVAEKIYQYDHVKNVYLMSSGNYDLSVLIEGRNLKDVAGFVAEKLAPMECVTATSTHFILKRYKDGGIIYENKSKDSRQVTGF